MAHKQSLVLPENLVNKKQVAQLLREIEQIQATQQGSKVRGDQPVSIEPSPLLQQLVDQNMIDGKPVPLGNISRALELLQKKAPVVHLSFAVNPEQAFVARIVQWFRSEVSPYVLLQVGLQPTIAAGCIVRTPSKYFDMTMRKRFVEKRDVLVKQLRVSDEQG